MAALTQTITNSLNVFGPAPSDKWNAYNWNAFVWGEGTAPLAKAVFKILAETVTLTDEFTKTQFFIVSNSLAPTTAITLEDLTDGSGYHRVFPGGVTDGTDRIATDWDDGDPASDPWAPASNPSTTWSQS